MVRQNHRPFCRYLMGQDPFSSRCILLTGQRGVGKTTCLIQHLVDRYPDYLTSTRCLYLPVDHFVVAQKPVYEIATDFANGPSVDCGYGQEDNITTIIINFDAGNSIYNSMKRRRSSIGSIDSCLSEEDEEEITLDGGYSNTNYIKRPSMDCGNASENEVGSTGSSCNAIDTAPTGQIGFSLPIQNNYF